MTDDQTHSVVEITVGHNEVRVQGSENFISQELSTILDRIDLGAQPQATPEVEEETSQATLNFGSENETESEEATTTSSDSLDAHPKLVKVAERINVEVADLAEYFYIDDDGIHVQNPMDIEPKYALLGYCTIKEELEGEPYHDNRDTKKKLIDEEKVGIERWGAKFLYNLRESGLIKNDPNSQKSSHIPFKITPQGRRELVNWLNEDD